MPVYLDADRYAAITGRSQAEYEEPRAEMACQLLDSRIGYYERQDDGWKLDVSALDAHELRAVELWCAWMIAYLKDNNDQPPGMEQITLGRFSVTPNSSDRGLLPSKLRYADQVLKQAGLVNPRAGIA
jgi:hypothetical protein